MRGSRFSVSKSISSKAEEAPDETNQEQVSTSKKESPTKSIRADEPDDKLQQITISTPDIISKDVTLKYATDDLHQDEQNKIEIREEIIPIRKDSRKKRIRTSSISANIDEINVPDVPLKDITAKYATGVHQDEQNKIEVREEIIPARKDSRKKRIRASSIAANTRKMNADPALKDVTIKFATDDVKQDEQNKNEVYEEIAPIRRDSQKKRIRTNSIAKRVTDNVHQDEQNKSEVREENKSVTKEPRRKSIIRGSHISAKMNAPDVSSKEVKLVFDHYQYEHNKIKDRALYEDDSELNPFVTTIIQKLAAYQGGITPKKVASNIRDGELSPKLGTLLGVFFPCVQNIFGVILFIRMVWIVGTAGWVETFIIFSICTSCTLTTSISMSAIATNGVVSGGGSYFMISRALGPEFGGAVGILFYLGTTVASSMYTVGAVEILLQYMAPRLAIFTPMSDGNNANNNYRIYGSALYLFMFICVLIGVSFVSKFSPVALACVLFSILCIYIGIFLANPDSGPKVCFVGERIIALHKIKNNDTGEVECHKKKEGRLYMMYCNQTTLYDNSDWCQYLEDSAVVYKAGIPGLGSGVFSKNMWPRFSPAGSRVGFSVQGDRERGDIVTDISTSFVILIGILFPSFTGFMAGSNRSGDLKDAQKSIPVGTISAVLITSLTYFSCMLLFAATVEGQFLRDKLGESMGGGLIVSQLAWPNPWVIMIGAFMSTCGAGLQSLMGAPRLLQAISEDNIIPFLKPFSSTSNGEPLRALLVTAFIGECGVLLANVDYLAPIITMFFLMCYCFTNMACAVQTILNTPNWRPRFKYYHWSLSLFGVIMCLCLMFMSSWYYALMAIGIAAFVYKYIEYKGAEKEWGDGLTGLSISAARFALARIEDVPIHVKNWRPQILVLFKLTEEFKPKYPNLFRFATQMKAGKGLILIMSVLRGRCEDDCSNCEIAKRNLQEVLKSENLKSFADVLMAADITGCLNYIIQGAGLGSLRHNTVLMAWPNSWKTSPEARRRFLEIIKVISAKHLATLIAKGIEQFPDNSTSITSGTIDVWWIVHDGGMLMLLPFLLIQHKVWKYCKMRIFTVAELEENSIQIKEDIEVFLYQLRIDAVVEVVEMHSKDISAYTYERTFMMEQRDEMWQLWRNTARESLPNLQIVRDLKHLVTPADKAVPSTMGKHQTLGNREIKSESKLQTHNIMRMHSAMRLNELIKSKSASAQLVILNLPGPPKTKEGVGNYLEFLEVLTEKLDRVLMIRGGGKEVITIYS